MAVYGYVATDVDASVVQGTVVADTPRQARDQLRERGLSVHEIASRDEPSDTLLGRWRLGLRRRDPNVGPLLRELSTLLAVGMPLLEALDALARQHRGRRQRRMQAVVLRLRDRVSAGIALADAMRQQGQTFDAVTVSMTAVGEQAGTLEQVLSQVADFHERSARLRSHIGAALTYPMIVLAVGLGVSIFLMTYVVPNLLSALVDAGRELPLITQLVKMVSDAIRDWWWLGLAGVGLAGLGGSLAVSTVRGRWLWHRMLLAIPALGELVRRQAIARIAFVVATLMRSGIAFEQALATARGSTANVVLGEALQRCERAVRAGRDIGPALEHTGAFPPTVVQVFALGQQSGRLEQMLERLATDYDRQVAAAAERLTAVLEPVLILLLAAIVGAIAMATILPILEISDVL